LQAKQISASEQKEPASPDVKRLVSRYFPAPHAGKVDTLKQKELSDPKRLTLCSAAPCLSASRKTQGF
jgi:hypothetical protein